MFRSRHAERLVVAGDTVSWGRWGAVEVGWDVRRGLEDPHKS